MSTPTTNYSFEKPDFDSEDWHTPLNANFDSIDTEIFGVQTDLDTKWATITAALTSSVYTDESPFANIDARLEEIEDELKQARLDKTLSTDRLKDWLIIGHNSDGTNKTGSFTFDQWENASMSSPAFATSSTFTISGDVTSILQPGTSLRMDYNISGFDYVHVKSASEAGGTTTVTVWDDETVINETIDDVHYGNYKSNMIGAAGVVGASVRDLDSSSLDVYRYDSTSYDDPWNEAGGRVAKTNSGEVARVDFASGQSIGITRTAVGGDISTVVRKLNDTTVETWTATYDGTTELLTDFDRS